MPLLNVVTGIKKMIFEGGGGIKKMNFGGFIRPCVHLKVCELWTVIKCWYTVYTIIILHIITAHPILIRTTYVKADKEFTFILSFFSYLNIHFRLDFRTFFQGWCTINAILISSTTHPIIRTAHVETFNSITVF